MIGSGFVLFYIVDNQKNHNTEGQNASSNNYKTDKSYAEQIIANCKANMHCSVSALNNMTKKENQQVVLATFSNLVLLYDKSNYPCHATAHHLGMWLYGYTTNLEKALSYTEQLCGGAVSHGILQGFFMTQRLHNVNSTKIILTNLCPQIQDNPYSIIRWQCLHGIGHGLAEFYDYDIVAAVNRCDELKPGWEQISCSKGLFMQNTVHYYETGKGDFDKDDIFFPCDKVSIKYAPSCYHYQTSYILKQNNFKTSTSFDECDKITPGTLVKYCYGGMGRQLSYTAYFNMTRGIANCYVGKQSIYQTDCLRGMLMTVVNRDTNIDKGFQFCSLSQEDFKANCYDAMGKWIMMLYSTQQERENECSKAENQDYFAICMNANLDNIAIL